MITYRSDVVPEVSAIVGLYRAAPLFRPVKDQDRIARTYAGSNIVLTAWDGERLVGVLRGLTDGAYHGYVCDLAVDGALQHQGVGRELLERVVAAYPDVWSWSLRSSQIAETYYPHVGWQRVENGWTRPGLHPFNRETEW
jgi:GNAT superfamily N-acetyltransferase